MSAPACQRCGNEYDQAFTVLLANGDRSVFDCFECAIATLAPKCARCGVAIIGHGLQAYGAIYCCAHCARRGRRLGSRPRFVTASTS